MMAWWQRLPATLQGLSKEFHEILEEITGRNPLLLKGYEEVLLSYALKLQNNQVGEADENTLLLKIHKQKDWVETAARLEKYAKEYIRNNEKEKKQYLKWFLLAGWQLLILLLGFFKF